MEIIPVHHSMFSSNCFILHEEQLLKLFIIDIGMSGLLTRYKLRKTLKEIVGEKAKKYQVEVFLTHSHIDHVTGENNLNIFDDITFSSSKQTAKHINARDEVTLLSKYHASISFTVEKTYSDKDTIKVGENELIFLEAPGHTDGSSVIYDKNTGSLFSGDVVFNGGVGRMDLPTGNQELMIKSLEKLASLEINHLYSGHGDDLHSNVVENIQAMKRMILF
ncbi:MAG: MBL fold metallo-hydrolase [Asgard group archaeon]|nr:MBL fold metallo-hydrolase [Asgard group archaeon]